MGSGYFGCAGLIYASPDICEAIDEAIKEEVAQMKIPIHEITCVDVDLKSYFHEPRHNHKRKPSRYGQR